VENSHFVAGGSKFPGKEQVPMPEDHSRNSMVSTADEVLGIQELSCGFVHSLSLKSIRDLKQPKDALRNLRMCLKHKNKANANFFL
jgi:hypothetical protein